MDSCAVRVDGLSKSYAGRKTETLQDLSFSIERGEFACILGPSGCGKSTLLNIIAGIDRPSSGVVEVADLNLSEMKDEELTAFRRENIGFIFQFFNLLPTFSVYENISLPLEIKGCFDEQAKKRVCELIEELGLTAQKDSLPAQLSGGEMQRTAIARAIIHGPRIVLADEPTGNLDSENGEKVLNLLKDINSHKGITIIMVTHSKEAASCASSTFLMRDGRFENGK